MKPDSCSNRDLGKPILPNTVTHVVGKTWSVAEHCSRSLGSRLCEALLSSKQISRPYLEWKIGVRRMVDIQAVWLPVITSVSLQWWVAHSITQSPLPMWTAKRDAERTLQPFSWVTALRSPIIIQTHQSSLLGVEARSKAAGRFSINMAIRHCKYQSAMTDSPLKLPNTVTHVAGKP
jgi:hypothetical protein